jgi:hypothetical protein
MEDLVLLVEPAVEAVEVAAGVAGQPLRLRQRLL